MKYRQALVLFWGLGCITLWGCQDKPKASSEVEARVAEADEANQASGETRETGLSADVSDLLSDEQADIIPPPPEMFGFECTEGTEYHNGRGLRGGLSWFEYWCEQPDGKKHGAAMRVSEDYLLDSLLVTFRSGVRHGPYKEWNSKGKLTREGNFVEGKYEGIWLWYYYNGRIRHRCTFEQGVADATSMKDDFCAHWFDPDPSEDFEPPPLDCPDGTTFQEVGRHRGVFSGAHITSTACVVTDGGESSPEGDVNKSGPIKEGPAADYTRRGVKTYEGRYEKNRPIGRETRWYPSDQLLSEGGWLGEGRRHGEWTFWWENGEIIATCTFEKGALVKFEGDKKTCMDALQKEVPVPIY